MGNTIGNVASAEKYAHVPIVNALQVCIDVQNVMLAIVKWSQTLIIVTSRIWQKFEHCEALSFMALVDAKDPKFWLDVPYMKMIEIFSS